MHRVTKKINVIHAAQIERNPAFLPRSLLPRKYVINNFLIFFSLSIIFSGIIQAVEGVDLAGDPSFDSNELACQLQPARRWLSSPGGRLCLNPSSAHDFVIDPLAADLSLNIGAYAGKSVARLPHILKIKLLEGDAEALDLVPKETWYPYKICFEAEKSSGGGVEGFDFFPNKEPALIRVIKVKGGVKNKLRIFGDAQMVEKSGGLFVLQDGYAYGLVFRRLEGKELRPLELKEKPVLSQNGWTIDLPVSEKEFAYAVGIGFSCGNESHDLAMARANATLIRPVYASLAAAKNESDRLLRSVPKPVHFGLGAELKAEHHRSLYYMAWLFLHQSTIDPLPEHPAYPFPQMSLGKGSLWAEGHPQCPATCGWESFLGIQWYALIDPEFGWRAFQGIMSLVDEHGQLAGESLPSRKAQTAWVLHQRKPDLARLAAIYPALRRYLLWREKNPRWIYGNNVAPDEKDLEFSSSWMLDVGYATLIAKEMGNELEVKMWQARQNAMLDNIRSWYFSDKETIHQFYFTERNIHVTPERNECRPIMILSAFAIPGLPEDLKQRLTQMLNEKLHPSAPNAGFNYTKFPDNELLALGLIDHKMPQAFPFIRAILRDSILCGEFAETVETSKHGAILSGGVKPSLFNALNIIAFTWLLNGVRYDSGYPVFCDINKI